MATHLYTYVNPTSKKHLQEICNVLADDGVIAYPTDVNWAFGCDASKPKAIDRIRALKKQHPKEQPFTLLCNSISMVAAVAHVDNFAFRLLARTLPGPYTIFLQRNKSLPRQIKDKRKIVGIRIPQSQLLLDLIAMYEKPLATTSVPAVTTTGKHPADEVPRFGYQIDEIFGHALDMVIDLGEEVAPNETTIVDLSEGEFVLVRQGIGPLLPFEKAGHA